MVYGEVCKAGTCVHIGNPVDGSFIATTVRSLCWLMIKTEESSEIIDPLYIYGDSVN